MATLTTDTPMKTSQGFLNAIGIIASDTVYEGAMVGFNKVGYGRPLTAGDIFMGHCITKVANESGDAGDLDITVRAGRYRMQVTLTCLVSDVGQPVYASDDSALTMVGASSTTIYTYVGEVTRYLTATTAEVEFRPFEFDEFGLAGTETRISLAVDTTTTQLHCGQIIYVTAKDKAITLDGTVSGSVMTVVNAVGGAYLGANNGIVVDFNGIDWNLGGCSDAAGTAGAALTNTSATARRGDYVKFIGDGADGWNLVAKRGIWAQA